MNEPIDLKAMALLLLRHAWIIILAFLLCFILTYFAVERPKVPVYSATATMYVSPGSSTYYSSGNQLNAQALINVCNVIVKSNRALTSVMEELDTLDGTADGVFTSAVSGRKYTAAAIKGMVNLSSVNNTEVMAVRVTCGDETDAIIIADAIVDVVPLVVEDIINSGYAKKVDSAYRSGTGNMPGLTKPAAIGFFAAALVSAIIILISTFDTRIHTKDDITAVYNVPIIGEIPDFSGKTNERYYARYEHNKSDK